MLYSLRWTFLIWNSSDEAEQVWLWEYETDEGAHDLYMDQGEEIRFRVTDEVFVDTSPTGPAAATPDNAAQPGQSTAAPAEESTEKKEAPYTLIVRVHNAIKKRFCKYTYRQNFLAPLPLHMFVP